MKYFLFLIGYFFVIPAYADMAIGPSPIELCSATFSNNKFLIFSLLLVLSGLIFSIYLLRLIYKKRFETINIVLFVCTLVVCIIMFVEKNNLIACQGNKDCVKEFYKNSEQIENWCNKTYKEYVNLCDSCRTDGVLITDDDYHYYQKKVEDCEKRMAEHWQCKFFENLGK